MSDLISRQAAIDIERRATVDTNPEHFESHQKFVEFMDDAEISSFGRWQWSNGFNTALTAVGIDLKRLPSVQPELSNNSKELDNENGELISRQAAIDVIGNVPDHDDGMVWEALSHAQRDVALLPSAQPKQKTGKWIYNSPVTMKCNQCGLVIKDWDWHRFKYCPNCCAKMEVKND